MLEFSAVIVLSIVEGLTEFLPVSSTGHLILVGNLLSVVGAKADTFEIFIQSGAILAVVVLYYKRFLAFFNFSQPTTAVGFTGATGLAKVGVACAPALVTGFVLHRVIKEQLFAPFPVAIALLVGAAAMLLIEERMQERTTVDLAALTYRQCFVIGIFQCFALWPGISRSASTIIGGMISGLDRKTAAEFSFIVAVPTMFAAVGYDLLKSHSLFQLADLSSLALGFVLSFVTALLAIRTFVTMLGKCTLRPFAYYRIVLAILVLVSLWQHVPQEAAPAPTVVSAVL